MKKLAAMILVGLGLIGCSQEPKTQAVPAKPSSNTANQRVSNEFKFASIAAGHLLQTNDPSVAKAKALLDEAAKKFSTSQEEISDIVVTVKNIADKEGTSFDMYQVLEAMSVIETRSVSNTKRFSSLISNYMAIRHSGQNHTAALVGLRRISQISDESTK